ncbi:Speckle-type POZ protein-like like protein [Argiope bruennichi]|uniref:Speckle-type POZ protein-like like protein n=1 Tax=Argiope bruennichi TaxID=94029 RepID=A0A8T0ESX2_ARGBR|nr:Speckle-type POZ protein-like like protein [Argiope bruennichi]
MVFKMCLIPWYAECPGKVVCLLIRDNIAPRFVHYLVDSEVTIDNKIWRQPETEYCFDIQEPKYVPLMHLSDLKDQSKFPFMCPMTLQFGLRRCFFKTPSTRYLSAITELRVINQSCIVSVKKFYPSRMKDESSERQISRNIDDVVISVGNEILQRYPVEKSEIINMTIGYCSNTNCVGIVFRAEEDSLYLRCEILLLDARRNTIIASLTREKVLFRYAGWLVPFYVPEEFLHKVRNSKLFFEAIDIHVSISYHRREFRPDVHSEIGSHYYGEKYFNLKADLENFYNHETRTTDFCIKAEKKIFQVHRCILAARSPVMKSMLENDMIEKRTGSVKIEDINSEVISLLLYYIYSSELKKNIEYQLIASLYAAADKYDIPGLRNYCRQELMKKVSISNFDDLLILSHLHRDNELKQFIISFLSTQYLNLKTFSHLDNIIMLDRRLIKEDIEFLRRIKETCIR